MTGKNSLLTIIMVSIWLWAPGSFGQDALERLENHNFDSPRRPAALFAHDDHNENAGLDECNQCHHVYDEDGNISDFDSSEDQACADCHRLHSSQTMPGLRKAFHQRCKGCHLKSRRGPVVCAECHVKE